MFLIENSKSEVSSETFKEEEKKLEPDWRELVPKGYPFKEIEGEIVEEKKVNRNIDIIMGRIPSWKAPSIITSANTEHLLYNEFVCVSTKKQRTRLPVL